METKKQRTIPRMYTASHLFKHQLSELFGTVETGFFPFYRVPRKEMWSRELVTAFIEVRGHALAVKSLNVTTE